MASIYRVLSAALALRQSGWSALAGVGIQQYVRSRGEAVELDAARTGGSVFTEVAKTFAGIVTPFVSGALSRVLTEPAGGRDTSGTAQVLFLRGGARASLGAFALEAAYERPVASILFTRYQVQSAVLALSYTIPL